MQKPHSITISRWLKDNLGKNALAGQTGTDQRALLAAVQIIELYSYDLHQPLLAAFGAVVERMQEKQRFLAYHAIAHVLDWTYRKPVWIGAGLPELTNIPGCIFEPERGR
jgi:hypothetical protein